MTSLTAKATAILPRSPINAEETAMTNSHTFETRADAAKSELTGEQLNIVSGGKWFEIVRLEHSVKSPRDAASGLATGRRQH